MGSRGKAFFRDLCSCGLNLLVWPRSCWGICPSASLVPDCSTFSAKKETNTGSGPERLADDFLAIQGFGNVCIEMAWHRDTRVLQLNRKVWSLQPLAGIQRDEQFVVLAPTPWCACVWLCVHSLVNWNPMHSGLVWVFPCNLTAGFAGRFNFLYVPLCFREKNSLCFLEDKWTLPWPRTIFTISFTLGDCVVIEPPWPVFGTRCRGHSHDQSFCWMRSEGRRVLVLLWVSGGGGVFARHSFLCPGGAILQKMSSSFLGRRRQHLRRVALRVFYESHCHGCVKCWQGANCVAGLAFCDTWWKLMGFFVATTCENLRRSRTKCSFWASYMSRLDSGVFLWCRFAYGESCKTFHFWGFQKR